MLAIQPGCLNCCDKELGAIGVFASIGHAHPAGPIVFQLEVLIREAFTVDALTWEERAGQGTWVGTNSADLWGLSLSCVRPGSSRVQGY